MKERDWAQLSLQRRLPMLPTPLPGGVMARLFAGGRTPLSPVAHSIYRLPACEAMAEVPWMTGGLAPSAFADFAATASLNRENL